MQETLSSVEDIIILSQLLLIAILQISSLLRTQVSSCNYNKTENLAEPKSLILNSKLFFEVSHPPDLIIFYMLLLQYHLWIISRNKNDR
jgi:hypothetical protein